MELELLKSIRRLFEHRVCGQRCSKRSSDPPKALLRLVPLRSGKPGRLHWQSLTAFVMFRGIKLHNYDRDACCRPCFYQTANHGHNRKSKCRPYECGSQLNQRKWRYLPVFAIYDKSWHQFGPDTASSRCSFITVPVERTYSGRQLGCVKPAKGP